MQEEVGIPACSFAVGFDASLGFVGADETEREAADDGHVLGAVTGSISGEIVAEFDIENPVHAFDAPVTPGALCEALDVERRRGDVGADVEGAAVGIFSAILHHEECLDAGKAWLTGIALVGEDPIDLLRGSVASGLDAAMAFLDRGLGDHFVFGNGAEIFGNLGFERAWAGWL